MEYRQSVSCNIFVWTRMRLLFWTLIITSAYTQPINFSRAKNIIHALRKFDCGGLLSAEPDMLYIRTNAFQLSQNLLTRDCTFFIKVRNILRKLDSWVTFFLSSFLLHFAYWRTSSKFNLYLIKMRNLLNKFFVTWPSRLWVFWWCWRFYFPINCNLSAKKWYESYFHFLQSFLKLIKINDNNKEEKVNTSQINTFHMIADLRM